MDCSRFSGGVAGAGAEYPFWPPFWEALERFEAMGVLLRREKTISIRFARCLRRKVRDSVWAEAMVASIRASFWVKNGSR